MKKKILATGQVRLAKLAKYLHGVPRARFDMREWASNNFCPETGCGTAACAIGHGAILFKSEGFKLCSPEGLVVRRPVYEGLTNWSAVEAFFEIDNLSARRLFGAASIGNQHRGPRQVAKRIKKYLKTGKI
jgi:hypothetical protein